MGTIESSREFWEEKARENAVWYISSFGPYDNRDLHDFWQSGDRIWSDLKLMVEYVPKPTDVVVDIGCGIGRLARVIAPDVGHVHGFDLSSEMVRRAEELLISNATFHVAEGCVLHPLPDASADFVFAYNVFQHLPSHCALREYLLEMLRVCRPGGRIAFTLAIRNWKTSLLPLSRCRAWLREKSTGPSGLHKDEWVGIRPSRSDVTKLSPTPLRWQLMHGDKWLFWASKQ